MKKFLCILAVMAASLGFSLSSVAAIATPPPVCGLAALKGNYVGIANFNLLRPTPKTAVLVINVLSDGAGNLSSVLVSPHVNGYAYGTVQHENVTYSVDQNTCQVTFQTKVYFTENSTANNGRKPSCSENEITLSFSLGLRAQNLKTGVSGIGAGTVDVPEWTVSTPFAFGLAANPATTQ